MTAPYRNKRNDTLSALLSGKLRFVWHIMFWTAGSLILFHLFRSTGGIESIDILYTLFFLIPIIIAVYLNLRLFIPRLLKSERYLLFLLSLAGITVLTALTIYFLFERWIDYILKDYYFVAYDNVWILSIYAGVFIGLSTLFKLSKEWIVLLRREKQEQVVQLKHLQAQINPHFLLNSLQTIYSQSLTQDKTTPETILKLAEILKFTLYETGENSIPLERELEIVGDYVDMYRMRIDPIRAQIGIDIEGDVSGQAIAPLLFLPFIENSIKHGVQSDTSKAFVDIRFTIDSHCIEFTIRNNTGLTDDPTKEQFGGIGIENTKKRLEIIYPGRHELQIGREKELFIVYLKVLF